MRLRPSIDDVTAEYVLVQAWKKTATYIRQHNWFAETLELDYTAANLPLFLSGLAEDMKKVDNWRSDPLRLVPAPKSQSWSIDKKTNQWSPRGGSGGVKLRPLAHASIRDQVASTAMMLCLADRVETAQGDPRDPDDAVSYGNRLFCDKEGNALVHRWGSSRLYRSYFSDYRSFIERPQRICEHVVNRNPHVLVVQSDLSRFYDRVRPDLLFAAIEEFRRPDDDPNFYLLAKRMMSWRWHPNDATQAVKLMDSDPTVDFSQVALPQGLVSSGFWSNLVLRGVDRVLTSRVGTMIAPGIRLWDACRYVDDLRLVVTSEMIPSVTNVQTAVLEMLQSVLDQETPGLLVSKEKTQAAIFRGEERPIIRQSRRMARVQAAVSGGFDAAGGEEIIEAIQGLVRTQRKLGDHPATTSNTPFAPVPDVGDATVARFAAGRFRTTYRSLRPLLHDDFPALSVQDNDEESEGVFGADAVKQSDLDDSARVFAFELVQSWIDDPSNVRLLRIALDVWPDASVLSFVLSLVRPHTIGASRGRARKVALYCLAEIFRAGATETAFVEDDEQLPRAVDVSEYRKVLAEEAVRVLELSQNALPWYVKQQAYLFLAAHNPAGVAVQRSGSSPETRLYRSMTRFLAGHGTGDSAAEYAKSAMIARRSFLGEDDACKLVAKDIDKRRFAQIARRDPGFAWELLPHLPSHIEIADFARYDLAIDRPSSAVKEDFVSLADLVLSESSDVLRTDLGISTFARAFLKWITEAAQVPDVIVPAQVLVRLDGERRSVVEFDIVFITSQDSASSSYLPPTWAERRKRWRFQLGYLLRFILTGNVDFTLSVRTFTRTPSRRASYRPTTGHWLQRHYSLYNGHESFGDDWLPISTAIEQFLYGLLTWPGCRPSLSASDFDIYTEDALPLVDRLARDAASRLARGTGLLMLPLPQPAVPSYVGDRPLRGCVVQTVLPYPGTFKSDISVSAPQNRRQHRNHLSTALSAVTKMLELRET